jgi:hypothetical protein
MARFCFEGSSLPPGFRFPRSYVSILEQAELPELDPWWFLAENPELATFWAETLKRQFPGRSLIPFAKLDTGDDLAAFDGSDTSGDPKVLYVHAYASPGWECRGEARNFDAWLQETKQEAEEYRDSGGGTAHDTKH